MKIFSTEVFMNTTRIEERFKDCPPEKTVENVKECLKKVNIELDENVRDAGVGNCYSVHVKPNNGASIYSNGKGVSPELARASGYAEFIERLQCGLLTYKYQSIARDPEIYLHSHAPDGRYMTVKELVDEGDWMDHIIDSYGGGLTREKLAEQCRMYACADDGKILTLPFYSLFEDKYVYLPAGFVEHMYSSNGCCAGNSRDEAWVHAFSEILERNSTIRMITSEKSAPEIPPEVINRYKIPREIVATVKESGNFDITIYDFSGGTGYPVVGTLLLNKETQDYTLNVSADPVLEIALSRGLTEIMQGKDLDTFSSSHSGNILLWDTPISMSHNILNQLETGNGLLSVNFFTEAPDDKATDFADNSEKTNSELLDYALKLFRDMGKQVLVRNYSFLGFNSYMFVVPGFSESRGARLTEKVQEYGLGDAAHSVFRNPAAANAADLQLTLTYFSKLQGVISRRRNLPRFAGLPLNGNLPTIILYATLSYASHKLGRDADAAKYLKAALAIKFQQNDPLTAEERRYLACLYRYLDLTSKKATPEQTKIMLTKLFRKETVTAFYEKLDSGENLYDGFLLKCDTKSCNSCPHSHICSYNAVKDMIKMAGEHYSKFTDGQKRENFLV